METSAIVMMITGMVVIWGGLAASLIHAVRKNRS